MQTALIVLVILLVFGVRLWAGYAYMKFLDENPGAEREALRRTFARGGY